MLCGAVAFAAERTEKMRSSHTYYYRRYAFSVDAVPMRMTWQSGTHTAFRIEGMVIHRIGSRLFSSSKLRSAQRNTNVLLVPSFEGIGSTKDFAMGLTMVRTIRVVAGALQSQPRV